MLKQKDGADSTRLNQTLEPACGPLLALVFERADHRIDHAAGQKIERGFAVQLIARAALDQSRSETALHRRDYMRAASLRPYQSQLRFGVFRDDLPIQRNGA